MAKAKLRAGDRVTYIDDVGGGVVLRLGRPGYVVLRTDDGFELEQHETQLIPVKEEERRAHLRVSDHAVGMRVANELMDAKRRKPGAIRPGKTPKKQEDNSVAEVDLHLHEIIDDERRLSEGERLEYQLRFFERALEAAIRNGKRKLIVIHGVGEGVLREEVRRILQYYDGVRFYDGEMRRYGVGATEVEILRGKG
ncbi:MAG: Smr/MutS family protein [Flavobacteriales bacterium]|nr:Smr/MutS family protein [Flavobacteriales bacterium]